MTSPLPQDAYTDSFRGLAFARAARLKAARALDSVTTSGSHVEIAAITAVRRAIERNYEPVEMRWANVDLLWRDRIRFLVDRRYRRVVNVFADLQQCPTRNAIADIRYTMNRYGLGWFSAAARRIDEVINVKHST